MDLDKLRIVFRSGLLPEKITAIHGAGENVYVALDNLKIISVYHRISHIADLSGHQHNIQGLFSLGTFLVSWSSQEVFIWDLETLKLHGSLKRVDGCQDQRKISCVIHPDTYANKLLVAYENTADLELWNLRTLKLVYSFRSVLSDEGCTAGVSNGITAMCASPHPDIVALGSVDGRLRLLDMKADKILAEFQNSEEAGHVTAVASRSDTHAVNRGIFACGCSNGDITVWDTTERRLLHTTENGHNGSQGVVTLTAIPGEPLIVSNGDDNSIIVWIFDLAGDIPRELRSRKGLQVPLQHLEFYDDEGKEILCLGSDVRQCSFGLVGVFQQHQNCQFQQRNALRQITQTWGRRLRYLPKALDVAFAYSRHHDWPNIATCHEGMSSVFLWSGHDKALVPRTIDLPSQVRNGVSSRTAAVAATSLSISPCGNYVVVGYKKGDLHKFNLQSGLYRGSFNRKAEEPAHQGSVAQVEILSQSTVYSITTAAADFCIRRWDLGTQKWLGDISFSSSKCINGQFLSSGLFKSVRRFTNLGVLTGVVLSTVAPDLHNGLASNGVAYPHTTPDDRSENATNEVQKVIILDSETGIVVREMPPVVNDSITAMEFSRDGRWIAYATQFKPYLYVYDILSSSLIDWIAFDSSVLSFSFHPSNAFLYLSLSHLKGGISVLGSLHVFDPTLTAPLLQENPAAPIRIGDWTLLSETEHADNDHNAAEQKLENANLSIPDTLIDAYGLCDRPLEPGRLTLSGVSEGRLQAILYLEQIKERNKAEHKVSAAPEAPFFLPTFYEGKELKFASVTSKETATEDAPISPHSMSEQNALEQQKTARKVATEKWDLRSKLQRMLSNVKQDLEKCQRLSPTTSAALTSYFESLSPSGIHLALSELGILAGGTDEELLFMLHYFVEQVYGREKADFVQTLLQVFLQQHATRLATLLGEADSTESSQPAIKELLTEPCTGSSSDADNATASSKNSPTPVSLQLRQKLKMLQQFIQEDWEPLELQCHQASCFLKFLTHTQIE